MANKIDITGTYELQIVRNVVLKWLCWNNYLQKQSSWFEQGEIKLNDVVIYHY